MDFRDHSISELVKRVKNKEISAKELTESALNNIEKYGSEILEESQNGLRYSVVGYSTDIGLNFYNDPNPSTNHSSIIGWAYDGNPIYGPYGYTDPTKLGPNIKTLQPSYKLDPSKVIDRPDITTFASFAKWS